MTSSPSHAERPIEVLAFIETWAATGPARNLILLARALAGAERPAARIRIATFTRNQASTPFIDACLAAGLEVDAIPERRRFDFAAISAVRDLVHRRRPDIVQTHNIKSHFFVRLCGLYKDFPWIAFNHGYTAEDLAMKIYNQVDRWSLRRAHRVVAVCGPFAERLRGWGVDRERVVVRHNAVSAIPPAAPEDVARLRCDLGIGEGTPVVLAVGRLSPEKAHADLLRAIALWKERFSRPVFRLVILGDGPERERLQSLSQALGIADLVTWAGTTSKVPLYYSLADVFVLPSRSEGSPNALLEAMMAGLPVVATAVGGVPEIVRSGVDGILIPAADIRGMAEQIANLLQDETLRKALGAEARASVEAHHSRQAYMESIVEIYRELAGRSG